MKARAILAAMAILLGLSACSDPATTFAAGLRSWCKSADSCTDHGRN
ncbi:hypothetical protein [Ferrovibrio sp.]